ncbi:MAG: FAD-binding oxidoreductase [Candidatus Marinimicrobia bacterium]|nr:FAD-binding oxidoreductase [Candidatus Neomarinimicrobiota bacterium]MCF7840852.1 FAD-binding oxidoreductase [Candidatus Neomarinimicrobiota bacterium]MCF7903010.1 FAD-binding oxidoreductase [Candidatus Neomarinimicrobiota bacterium]
MTEKSTGKSEHQRVYWLRDAEQQFPELDRNLTCDVIIIGGGITGTAAAYWMRQAGARVVLLEEELVASGASGRNGGFLLTGTVEHYARAVALIGGEKTRRLFDFTVENIRLMKDFIREHEIGCDLDESGSLHAAISTEENVELRESATLMQTDGFQVEYRDEADIAALTQSDLYKGGLFTPEDAGVHPARMVSGIAKEAVAAGAQIFENTPVTQIIHDDYDSVTVETPKGRVSGYLVLLGTNAYSQLMDDFFQDKILPVRGHAMVTSPITQKLWNPVIYANFGYEYFRQLPDGRVLMGGMRESVPGGDAQHFNELPDERVTTQLIAYLKDNFTALKTFTVDYEWAGIMGFSRDGIPMLGSLPGKSNVFAAGGYTGHGMGFGFSMGRLAAQVMLDGENIGMDLFSLRRLVK